MYVARMIFLRWKEDTALIQKDVIRNAQRTNANIILSKNKQELKSRR